MRKTLLLILLGFISLTTLAQNPKGNSKISGTITDSEGLSLAYVSVAAHNFADSSLADGALTSETGKFEIYLKPGKYYLELRLMGYENTKQAEAFQVVKKENLELNPIPMQAKAVEMDAVELQADVNQMTLHLDKRVFNVQKDLSNTGRNASEILDNLPSVSVDIEGNVSLRGSQNVRILVDGKPSGLVAGSPDALRQMQGSMIEKIEVITNPSARYDAEGEVGIINIVLKKDRKNGLNGSYELALGLPHNYRAALSMNWRKKAFNLFMSGGIGYRRSPGGGLSEQFFSPTDTSFYYLRDREQYRGALKQNFRFGSDIFLNKSNTLTISGLYRGSVGQNLAILTYRDFNELGLQTDSVVRRDEEEETKQVIEANLSYQNTFKKKGQKWTIDLKWTQSDDSENSDILETSNLETPLNQRVNNREDERTYFLQTDYIHPFAKKGKFEAGLRSTLRRIFNDYSVEEDDGSGNWFVLPDFNNEFRYDENIHAAYVILGNQTGKFSYQGGLRTEYSQIRTELVLTGEKNPRDYLSLFPSAHLSYKLSDKHTLQFSYSRRISRPRFRYLLPFSSYGDARNFRSGNPNLDPEFTHSTELGYLRYLDKGSLLSSIYYRYRTGVIQRIQVPDTLNNILWFPINLATQQNYGFELNFNYQLRKWWKVSTNLNFYRSITQGQYEDQNLNADALTWNGRLTSKASLFKFLESQLTFNYNAPYDSPQGRTLARWHIDLAFEKDILKGNGTLIFSISDLFNTRKYRWEVGSPGDEYYSTNEFQWRSRQFNLTFNYRLNQKKKGRRSGGFGGEF